MYKCRAPKNKIELDSYYQLRWQVLREPWQQPKGSEKDDLESQSYHRVIVDDMENILGVGRLHLVGQNLAQIRYMAITKLAQGKGLGKRLLDEFEIISAKLGVSIIELNARENALGFYLKLNYQNQGFSHILYHQIRHNKMIKTLSLPKLHLNDKARKLQALWHQTIPLSKAMNINICYFDQKEFIVNCDEKFNKNLHNTMFAGSIYTLATLTGWGWLYFALQQCQHQTDIVLAKGDIHYIAPLTGVAHAKTSQLLVVNTANELALGKNARFTIEVQVCCGDNTVAIFTGYYVAVLKK